MFVTLSKADLEKWNYGHCLIRQWAVEHLPRWQQETMGQDRFRDLCTEYISLQDRHDGNHDLDLDRYCRPPGPKLSLHDVQPIDLGVPAMQWYLHQIREHLRSSENDEAIRFLGVLCHWHEDPGSPSAHSSPVSETALRQLIPPPRDKENYNYIFGYGGISHLAKFTIPAEDYTPKLLGASIPEAGARMYQAQRVLRHHNARYIVPVVQDTMYGDGVKADEARSAAALYNAKHVADVIYTALCLAADRIDADEAAALAEQPLTEWVSEFTGGPLIGHPYYVVPFLVNQSMDADRNLHPLRFAGDNTAAEVEYGFGMGTPFTLQYLIAPGGLYSSFSCRVGLHPTAGKDGSVAFRVLVDGNVAAETGPIASGVPPESLRVDLPDTRVVKLALQTVPTPRSPSLHNLTVWGEPTLHRAESVPEYIPADAH